MLRVRVGSRGRGEAGRPAELSGGREQHKALKQGARGSCLHRQVADLCALLIEELDRREGDLGRRSKYEVD